MPFHHFQESEFATLSGARVVRVAVHPEMQHMGYGSRAIDQLIHYYQVPPPISRHLPMCMRLT